MKKFVKKAFTVSVVLSTILWSVGASVLVAGVANAAADCTLSAGQVVQSDSSALFTVNADLELLPWEQGWQGKTWYSATGADAGTYVEAGYPTITKIDKECFKKQTLRNKMPIVLGVRPGSFPLYQKDSDRYLYPIGNYEFKEISKDAVKVFFGDITPREVSTLFVQSYGGKPTVTGVIGKTDLPPKNLLVKDGEKFYVVTDDAGTMKEVSDKGLSANGMNKGFALKLDTATSAKMTKATGSVDAYDASFGNAAKGAEGGTTTPKDDDTTAAGDLAVSLSSSNPATATILSDSTAANSGAQALIPFASVQITASDAVKLKSIKFTRFGIASDSDITASYLFDGDKMVAEYSSFDEKVITFYDSAGLVSLTKDEVKTLTLKANIAGDTSAAKTIGFEVAKASDMELVGKGSVKGTFPLMGNKMTTASVDDLGSITVANVSPSGTTTVDPEDGVDIWKFSLASADQKMSVSSVTITNVGSADDGDVVNFKLMKGGTQVGSTVSKMVDDKVTFDLSKSPLEFEAGETFNYTVKADVLGGSTKTFQFQIANQYDIVAMDKEYNVYTVLNLTDSYTIIQAGGATTINAGTLTVTRATDSPSGNVTLNQNGVTLAKFKLVAKGEPVKVTQMFVSAYDALVATDGLNDGKVKIDGVQKGSTTDLLTASVDDGNWTAGGDDTAFNFGNTFTVTPGTDVYLTVVSDTKKSDATTHDANDKVTIAVGGFTATGKSSNSSVTVGTGTGHQVTMSAAALSVTEDLSIPDFSSSVPNGVAGSLETLMGQWTVSAGASEGVDIQNVQITVNTSSFQNLKVTLGGTQVGTTRGSLTNGSSYTFTANPNIQIAAGKSLTLKAYVDILSSAGTGAVSAALTVADIDATGTDTSKDASPATTDVDGQNAYVGGSGSLSITVDADTPKSAQIIMGGSEVEFSRFRMEETSGAESVKITALTLDASLGGGAATSTFKDITIYSGESKTGGMEWTSVATNAAITMAGEVVYDLSSAPIVVPASGIRYLKVGAKANSYGLATAGGTVEFQIGAGGVTDEGATTGAISGSNPAAGLTTVNPMYVYRTKLTLAKEDLASTTGVRAAAQEAFSFSAVADGAYSATIRDITLRPTGSDTTPGTGDLTIYDASDLSTALITLSNAASTTASGVVSTTGFGTTTSTETSVWGAGALAGDLSTLFTGAGSGTGYVILLESEYMLVTAASTTANSTTLTVVRGFGGSTAATHATGNALTVDDGDYDFLGTADGTSFDIPIVDVAGAAWSIGSTKKTYVVYGDMTSVGTSAATLYVKMNAGDVGWRDGAVNANITDYTKNLPITGDTKTFAASA